MENLIVWSSERGLVKLAFREHALCIEQSAQQFGCPQPSNAPAIIRGSGKGSTSNFKEIVCLSKNMSSVEAKEALPPSRIMYFKA